MLPRLAAMLVTALTFCTIAAPAQDLLSNGGFEEGRIDGLPGWHRQPWAKGVALDEEVRHSGARSLRVFAGGGMETDLLPYPGGRLSVSGWMKTEGLVRGPSAPWHQAALQLISYDAERKSVGHSDINLMEGTQDWTRVEGTVLLSRAVAFVSVVCHIWGEDTQGTVWFDDVTMERLDPDLPAPPPIRLDSAHLNVDFSQPTGPLRHLWLGSDVSYSDRVLSDTQRKGMELVRGIGFEYVRMHDCVHNPRIYSEDAQGKPVYSWEGFDKRVRAVLDHGMKPVVVLETMPPQFATGNDGLDWTNRYPPKGPEGYRKWQDLVRAIVAHGRETWGEAIHEWYFEVWNEPDASGYFAGTLDEYLKVYDHAVAGATAADPGIRIGGPGGAGTGWLEPLLRHCSSGVNDATGQTGCRIDFLSWHIYTVGVGVPVFDALRLSLMEARAAIGQFPQYAELPTLITEWGCSSSTHPVHDTSFDAAFRTMAVKEFMDAGIDLALPFCLAEGPYHAHDGFLGGLALVTKIGVPKPSFRAFELLRRIEGERATVRSDNGAVDALAAVSSDGDIAWVMLYGLIEDYRHAPYTTEVTVDLTGLPGEWRCQSTSIAPGVCDPAAKWVELGSPETVTPEQKQLLLDAGRLPAPQPVAVRDGRLSVQLPGFSVMLLELQRAR